MQKLEKSPLEKDGSIVSDTVAEITKRHTKINQSDSITQNSSVCEFEQFALSKERGQYYLEKVAIMQSRLKGCEEYIKKADITRTRKLKKIRNAIDSLKLEVKTISQSDYEKVLKQIDYENLEYDKQYAKQVSKVKKLNQNILREVIKLSIDILEELFPHVALETLNGQLVRTSYSLLRYRNDSSADEYQSLVNSINPKIYEVLKNISGEKE
jgi:hypothetical protein